MHVVHPFSHIKKVIENDRSHLVFSYYYRESGESTR